VAYCRSCSTRKEDPLFTKNKGQRLDASSLKSVESEKAWGRRKVTDSYLVTADSEKKRTFRKKQARACQSRVDVAAQTIKKKLKVKGKQTGREGGHSDLDA